MSRFIILIPIFCLLISCSEQLNNPVESGETDQTGSISFSMSLRTITSQYNLHIDSVCVRLQGPTTVNIKLSISSDSTNASGTITNLSPGDYSIMATMFSGVDTIATGTGNATILPGKTTTANIIMSFSPGKLLIIVSWQSSPKLLIGKGNFSIPSVSLYTMNSDGSDITLIHSDSKFSREARWNFDKSKITFNSNNSTTNKFEIFIMNGDGTNVLQLTSDAPEYGNGPSIFRDASKIWYSNAQSTGWTEIIQISYTGTEKTKLTDFYSQGKSVGFIDINSNSTKICYYKQTSSWSPDGEIYIANIDLTGETRLTNNSMMDNFPRFSPAGDKIVFTRETAALSGISNVFVMNIDGSNVVQLTNYSSNSNYCVYPMWSPDGKKIAFSFTDGNHWDIYIMNADGTSIVNITNTPDIDEIAYDWK